MRKKEFIFDNCKLCQYGGATKKLFGNYYENLKRFFKVPTEDKSKIADQIIMKIVRQVTPEDLNIILNEYEPAARTSRKGKKPDLNSYTTLQRFERFDKLNDIVIKAILQGYKNNPSNTDFYTKLEENPDLSNLYNDSTIVTVLSSEEELEEKKKLEQEDDSERAEQQAKQQAEIESKIITSEGLLTELNNFKNQLCNNYGGVTCIPSDNEICTNPMSNKFIDGIESKREAAKSNAKEYIDNIKAGDLSQIIKNYGNKSVFDVEKFIKLYDYYWDLRKKDGFGKSISRTISGNLVGNYTGKIYLDTLVAFKFLMNFFYTSGWGGSSVHTVADQSLEKSFISGSSIAGWDQRLYGMWSKYKVGSNWLNYISNLRSKDDRFTIYMFKMKTIEIDNTSPIAAEFRNAKIYNEANIIVDFIENIVIMSVFITIMIYIIPIIGVSFINEAHVLSSLNPLVAIPIYKTFAFLFGALVESLSRSISFVSKFNLRKSYFNFKSFIKLKYINYQLRRKIMNDISLEYNSIYNKIFSGDILQNYIPSSSSKDEDTINLLKELNKKLPEFLANEMFRQEINYNIDYKVTSKYLNYATLTYNNNKSINNLFKKNFIESIFEAIDFKDNNSTPNSWEELKEKICINAPDESNFKQISDVQKSSNVMLKKFYISCFYVVLLYVKKHIIKSTDKSDKSIIFNKVLNQKLNTIIHEKSIKLAINYFNYFCTNVIISLLKTHDKLDCSSNEKTIRLDSNKYEILEDLYIKYKTNTFFEKEYDLTTVSKKNENIRKKIIKNIVNSSKIVKDGDGNRNNILYSNLVYPDSIIFSGEHDSINNEINNWFNIVDKDEINYIKHVNNYNGCEDYITKEDIEKTLYLDKLSELNQHIIEIEEIPFDVMARSNNCEIVGENLYSNENIFLEWSNIINYNSNNNFDLSETLFIQKLLKYYKHNSDKTNKLNQLFRYDKTQINTDSQKSYKFARFKSELFECLPNLLLIIDYKIPVSLFNSNPNKKYTFSDRSKIYTPEGVFSRTKEYNQYFNFNTDLNDTNFDLSPINSLNQSASNVQDNQDLKTIYYNYNDIYKTVLDTFKLYQKCLNNIHHQQALNDFIINLRYNHSIFYNFDNINFKIDNYTKSFSLLKILPGDVENKFTSDVGNKLNSVQKLLAPKSMTYQASKVNGTIFSFNLEKNYSEIIKDKIGNLSRIEGVFGNGNELVEKNLLPSVNVDDFSLNNNIWYYYDITSDNLCFNIRGDYDKNNSDSLYICSNNNMSHKITSNDINDFSKNFIDKLFSNTSKISSRINYNDDIISTSSLTREQIKEVYRRYLNDLYCQMDYNVNLSSNNFGKSRSINYVTMRDIIENENFTDSELETIITSIVSESQLDNINLKNFLSNDEILDIKWKIVFTQLDTDKLKQKSGFIGNGSLIEKVYNIEPVFSVENNIKKNILEHAESIDTYESKYVLKSNNLSKLFREKLIIQCKFTDINTINKKPINFRELIKKYLSKYSFLSRLPIDKKNVHIEPYVKNITPKLEDGTYELIIDINLRKYSFNIKTENNLFVYGYEDISNREQVINFEDKYKEWFQFSSKHDDNFISTKYKSTIDDSKIDDLTIDNTYFSCGIPSNLGKICNKIYDYFILGKIDGIDVKTFTYKYDSTKKFVINKYIEYINNYRNKLGINGHFGIRFTGHSSGGAIAAGIIYMMLYKMITLNKMEKDSDKSSELEDIFKQSRAYSYGAPRTFDTNTGIIINYIDKLYDLKKTIELSEKAEATAAAADAKKQSAPEATESGEEEKAGIESSVSNNKINNIINLFCPLSMISWNNVHVGRLIYLKNNTWNDLGFKIFSIQKFICNQDGRQNDSDIYNWNEGLQYNNIKDSEIKLFTEKCIYLPKDQYKSSKIESSLTREFHNKQSSEPYLEVQENTSNHVALNPIKITDMVENMEFDFISDPIKAYIYENKIITSQIGYKNFGRNSNSPIVINNIVFPFIKSWISNLSGLENHNVNRNWVRHKQLRQEKHIHDLLSENQRKKIKNEFLKPSNRKKELDVLMKLADKCNPSSFPEQSTKPECADKYNKCAYKAKLTTVNNQLTKINNYDKCKLELEQINKNIYTYFEQNTGYGMDRSITPGIINNTYNLLYNIRCMHYKEQAVEQIESLHLYEKNIFSNKLQQKFIESLYKNIELFQFSSLNRKKHISNCYLNVILMSLYSNPYNIYIEELSNLSEKHSVTFKLHIHNNDINLGKQINELNFSIATVHKDQEEIKKNLLIIYVMRYISTIRKKLRLNDNKILKLTSAKKTNIISSIYVALIKKILTCIYNINTIGLTSQFTYEKDNINKSINNDEYISYVPLNNLIQKYKQLPGWIYISDDKGHTNYVLKNAEYSIKLNSNYTDSFNLFNIDFLGTYGLSRSEFKEYLYYILDRKWILFDVKRKKTYIILKINQYDLYEKIVSQDKLYKILCKNTSIIIDKINLESWYMKYSSMSTNNNKYIPNYLAKIERNVILKDKISLPISPTCFIKINNCSNYVKSSDPEFVDIKIDNKTSKEIISYLRNVSFDMNKRRFGIELYFNNYTDTLTEENKIKDYDFIHSIRTNILLDREKLKALDKDGTKQIGNNIILKISPTNIKNYIKELLDRIEQAPSNRFIIFKILRLDSKGVLRSSISEPVTKTQPSDINIIDNELFCKFNINFEINDQLVRTQLINDAIKARAEANEVERLAAEEKSAEKKARTEKTKNIAEKAEAAARLEAAKAAAEHVAVRQRGVEAAKAAAKATAKAAAAAAAEVASEPETEAEAKVKAESGAEAAEAASAEVASAEVAATAKVKAESGAEEATAKAKPANAGKWKCTQCGFINDCFSQYCLRCSTSKNNPYKGDYDGFNYCNKPPMPPPLPSPLPSSLPPQPPSSPKLRVQILKGGDWSKESIYDVNSLINDSNSESDWSDSD